MRGISYDILSCIFPPFDVHPPIVPPPPPPDLGPPPSQPPVQPPPASLQANLGDEVHIGQEVLTSLEIIKMSSDEGGMELDEPQEELDEEVGKNEPLEEELAVMRVILGMRTLRCRILTHERWMTIPLTWITIPLRIVRIDPLFV